MHTRRWIWAAVAAALVVAQTGCTFFALDGGGPMRRDELGDWLGMGDMPAPSDAQLKAIIADLKTVPNKPFASQYSLRGDAQVFATNFGDILDVPFSPAPGLRIKGRQNPWLRFVPGPQHGDWYYFDEKDPTARQFYAAEDEWDALVAWGERVDCWDVATRTRVGARASIGVPGLGIGWNRLRLVQPVDDSGIPGLDTIAYSKRALDQVLYDVRDGNILLFGAVGWGRVNHRRYLQLFWVPIPVGRAGP